MNRDRAAYVERRPRRWSMLVIATLGLVRCGGDDSSNPNAAAGTGGHSGSGASTGTGGSGTSGAAGSSNQGGTSGAGGTGTGGAGTGGAGTGGAAGGGASGAGNAGSSGAAGQGGSAGTIDGGAGAAGKAGVDASADAEAGRDGAAGASADASDARDGVIDAGSDGSDAATSAGDVVGKVSVGYQGWFTAPGDGSPRNQWWHYCSPVTQPPSPTTHQIKAWPDMREFTATFQTAFANLGNGQPATLFSSYSDQTVNTHLVWLQQNGIDTVALQRFSDEIPTRNGIALKVRSAAETYGRKFYIMYDISGWTNFQAEIKTDWTNNIVGQLQLLSSSAYAKQNGKPVVSIWGMGFTDRPGDAAACTDVINFFKNQGLYVIGGVPLNWRTSGNGGKPNFGSVYDSFNMISPWMVGVIGNVNDSNNIRTSNNAPDVAYCNSHGMQYQPCVLPGDLALRQRAHGDFMWRQFANMIEVGAHGIYVSMFDEFNEGNQIAKTAESVAMVPTNSTFLGLNEDGVACSADYYLRLTGDGGKMLKGQIPLTFTRPTVP
ncbi:MAG TPA: glycoside hydrolase family 71/99-like protein [Polyangiaceae bacterium]|nr:glycoside hydrolase family 71/99-like protein [Polyangiaceae bacterium]